MRVNLIFVWMALQPILCTALGESVFYRVCGLLKRVCLLSFSDDNAKHRAISYIFFYVFGLQFHNYAVFFLKCTGIKWGFALLLPFVLLDFRRLRAMLSSLGSFVMQLKNCRIVGLLNFALWMGVMFYIASGLQYYRDEPRGIYTMWMNAYGDFPFHLGMITSFVTRDNFPPEYHILENNRLTYPFMANSWAAQFFALDEIDNWHNLQYVVGYQWMVQWTLIFFFLRGHDYYLVPWAMFFGGGTYFTIGKWSEERDVLYGRYPWATFMTTIWGPQRSAAVGAVCSLAAVSLLFSFMNEFRSKNTPGNTDLPSSIMSGLPSGSTNGSSWSPDAGEKHVRADQLRGMSMDELQSLCRKEDDLPRAGTRDELILGIIDHEFTHPSGISSRRGGDSMTPVGYGSYSDRFFFEPKILLAGMICAFGPLFHVHFTLFTILFIGVTLVYSSFQNLKFSNTGTYLSFTFTGRRWFYAILTFIIGLIPSFLSLPWLIAGKRTAKMISLMFGWSELDDPTRPLIDQFVGSVSCWTRNAFQLFIVIAIFWYVSKSHNRMIPWAFLFMLANVVKLAPWIWDHMKVFIGLYVIFLAIWAHTPRSPGRQRLFWVHLIIIIIMIPGAVEVGKVALNPQHYHSSAAIWDQEEMDIADSIVKYVPPEATVMGRDVHNSPIAPTGRKIFKGFPAWIITHGLDDYKQNKVFLAKLSEIKGICEREEIRPLCPDYLIWGRAEQSHWSGQQPLVKDGWEPVDEKRHLFRLKKENNYYSLTKKSVH